MIFQTEKKEYHSNGSMTLHELMEIEKEEGAESILLANVNGKLRELFHRVREGDRISWITASDKIGYETYRRSCSMLFLRAVSRVAGDDAIRHSILHFSIGDGFYFTLNPKIIPDERLLKKIDGKMREMVEAALPFQKMTLATEEALRLFHKMEMEDKEKLFSTRLASTVNIYNLDGFCDYYYGFMVHDTSVLREFQLHLYDKGIVLQLPKYGSRQVAEEFRPSRRLFDAQVKGEEFAASQKIGTVAELNQRLIHDGEKQIVMVSEAKMAQQIAGIAKQITQQSNVKFVMIAGPSSSGKTTFSQRLALQLAACGKIPHYIGVDNYFLNRADVPLDEYGQKDFESIRSVDLDLFHRDMGILLEGGEIRVPTFDFLSGERVYTGETLRLQEDEILVIEGIHCLNGELTGPLPKDSMFRIYISALTQLNLDCHNRISTTDGRLLRRIVRDNRTRGYSVSNTLAMWDSVRRGEEKYIFPYQDQVDVFFNSALPYEMAVLKTYAVPLLFQVTKEDPFYNEARRLLKFLDYFIGVPGGEVIANDSILREFIGGGCFRL